ncbi:MAG: cell division protein SepF [Pseudonocardiaceae bacterium]
MSALYRLKAYFGMVPAEEFDDYHPDYRSGYDDPGYDMAAAGVARERDHAAERPGISRGHRADFGGYDDGMAAYPGRSAVPRVHPSRPPSWVPNSRIPESRATASWTAEAPVHGSLAIDTATTAATVRQPVAPAQPSAAFASDPFADNPLASDSSADQAHPLSRIVTLHPHNYNEARPIGERFREGNPVIMNLTEMEDRDAKRLVDFAAGLAFALRGSIDKVTNKVFLLSPPNVDVSAEDRRRIAEGRFLG